MLVLSRKKDESIIINDHIRVTVVEIRGDKVRLGIDAPKDVSVHRREVYEAIQNQLGRMRPTRRWSRPRMAWPDHRSVVPDLRPRVLSWTRGQPISMFTASTSVA